MKMKSLQMKILSIFGFILLITIFTLSYIVYSSTTKLIETSLGTVSRNIAIRASEEIDVKKLEKVVEESLKIPQNESSAETVIQMQEYIETREILANFKRTNGIKFLYTMTEYKKGEYMYVVDGFPTDYKGDDISLPGDIEQEEYEDLTIVFTEKHIQTGKLSYDSTWGANVTTYVPIINEKGDFIGVIGVDFEATEIFDLLENNKKYIVTVSSVILIISLILSYVLSRLFIKPLKILTKNVNEIKDGNFKVSFDTKREDEIGQLSNAFNDMVNDLQKMFNKIQHFAFHDGLTGLLNRVAFEKILSNSIEKNKTKKENMAVLFIDLDKFKQVNDSYGHDIGDSLLKEVATRIKKIVNKKGIPSRLGGDEFIILLNKLENHNETIQISDELLQALRPPFVVKHNGQDYKLDVTPSIGIVLYPEVTGSAEELIKYADSAMYVAKQSGKNRYEVYKKN